MSQMNRREDCIWRATLYKSFPDADAILALGRRHITGHLRQAAIPGPRRLSRPALVQTPCLGRYARMSHQTRRQHEAELATFLQNRDEHQACLSIQGARSVSPHAACRPPRSPPDNQYSGYLLPRRTDVLISTLIAPGIERPPSPRAAQLHGWSGAAVPGGDGRRAPLPHPADELAQLLPLRPHGRHLAAPRPASPTRHRPPGGRFYDAALLTEVGLAVWHQYRLRASSSRAKGVPAISGTARPSGGS